MSIQTAFKKYTRTLTAGIEIQINVSPANVVLAFESDGEFTVKPDGLNPCSMEKGLKLVFDGDFSNLRLISDTTQTVEIYVGRGDITDNRIVGAIQIEGSADADYGAVTCANTATQLVAADTNRKSVLITNNGTEFIYIGNDASVTTANGIPLDKNASITIETQSSVYGISETTDNDVRYFNETIV